MRYLTGLPSVLKPETGQRQSGVLPSWLRLQPISTTILSYSQSKMNLASRRRRLAKFCAALSSAPELGLPGSFPILKSKSGTDGQTTIRSKPDEHWIPKKRDEEILRLNGGVYSEVKKMLQKAGHLLITAGQRNTTGCLVAVASEKEYVGNGWMPVPEISPEAAKATAVFINSTAGRLQMMRNPGRTIEFPTYSAAEAAKIKIPRITKNDRIRGILSDCWERTKDMKVSQFRDGECEVRRLWDEAVADAMGWDSAELERLRLLLHAEPHVRGLGYGQYADEIEQDDAISVDDGDIKQFVGPATSTKFKVEMQRRPVGKVQATRRLIT